MTGQWIFPLPHCFLLHFKSHWIIPITSCSFPYTNATSNFCYLWLWRSLNQPDYPTCTTVLQVTELPNHPLLLAALFNIVLQVSKLTWYQLVPTSMQVTELSLLPLISYCIAGHQITSFFIPYYLWGHQTMPCSPFVLQVTELPHYTL